ncbi:(S)-beta-macrocarpene synthase [Zea mays]|uniref:(S)-beta-macrocarpene synthase n=1 Tax=Zea mays TaxID=4577 RepID=A0A3L6G681_MAIZE|nr:(S)-beta-macrocarpene synthase [Zea mays]
MAALTQTTDGPRLGEQEMKKMSPSFHPTLWGDFFLSYEAPTEAQEAQMREKAGVLKEEVRNMIKGSHDVPEIVDLIITLQRLNLDYHYEDEITEKLTVVYNSNYDGGNLDLVSRRFYLLRKCGYHVSSDVFLNFKDQYGNFIEADTRSLLSLYNAAYLRIHDETVLDEAISFTTRCLQDRLEHLESPIAEEVSSALDTPLFRRVGTLEMKDYIPIYEKDAKQNKSILEFAKLNFNLLQLLYSSELKECTAWWKELHVESNLSFVRDRIVEVYFWMSGGCYDPQYSHSRIILTKIVAFITILDDTLDSHANSYESMQLAEAVERYVKELVREYTKEIKWRDEDYVPKTLKEHLKVSLISIGGTLVLCSAFVGMGDVVTKKIMEWVMSDAELVKSFGIFVRLSNDIVSTKREQREKHCVSTVQCYMKQHELTMDEACEQIKELTEDSWKFMIEQGLALKEYSIIVPRTVLEFARTVDYMYKEADKYTVSHTIKDMLTSLYVKPVLM